VLQAISNTPVIRLGLRALSAKGVLQSATQDGGARKPAGQSKPAPNPVPTLLENVEFTELVDGGPPAAVQLRFQLQNSLSLPETANDSMKSPASRSMAQPARKSTADCREEMERKPLHLQRGRSRRRERAGSL
jgi:hypothetical protein